MTNPEILDALGTLPLRIQTVRPRRASRVFEKKDILRMLQGRLKHVSRVLTEYFKEVLRGFL